MATDLKPQPKTTPALKHEQFVEQQLDRARRRIRKLDTLTSVLVLLIGVLLYGLAMAALDRAFALPAAVRAGVFLVAAAVAAFYGALIVFRRVQWHVNPYYAARRLEETIPNAKNSLINWLDLRDAEMPPVIRGTLGRQAAKDLNEADLDNAVSSRRPLWLAAVAGGLTVVLLVWFVMAPGQLRSLLKRALFPFEKADIATRTHIELLTPAGGDATVPVRQDVQIRVQVTGRVPRVNQPDALRLHFRYRQSDPYLVRPLDEDADGQWFKTVLADEVQDGFFYKVTGGDFATPEHRIKVRALPQVTRFDVTYHYRPYLKRDDFQVRYGPTETFPRPDLKELRGTEVTLLARTNRVWRSGHLVLQEGQAVKNLQGEPVADDPQAKQFKFVLDRDGAFSMQFISGEGEANIDRSPYTISVIEDLKPRVALTKPGKNIELPANGTLSLEGWARDDYGIKGMTLRLRVKKGPRTPDLAPKPYRPGVDLKAADGTYPADLVYQDFVALEKLKTAKGEAFPLAAGMVLEYWLEAVDNCDYPEASGNVGKSEPPFLVTIVAPDQDEKRQQQARQKAAQEKAQHDKEQAREQQRRNQQAQEKQEAAKQDPATREKHEKERLERVQQEMEKVRQELERQKKEQEQKGVAKGDPSADRKDDKNPSKDGQGTQDKKGGNEPKKGEQNGGNEPNKQQNAGQQPMGDGKDKGKPDPQAGPQGQAKDQKGPGKDQAPSQAKGDGNQQQPGQQAGAEKDKGGGKEQKAETGKSKDDGKGGMGGGAQQAAKKEPGGQGGDGQQAAQAKGDGQGAGGQQPQQAQAAPKDGPKGQAAAGKGAGDDKGPPQASQAKGPGQQGQPQQAQGGGNGPQGKQAKGSDKGPGKRTDGASPPQAASAKGGDPQSQRGAGAGAGQKKDSAPEKAKTAGQGKGERRADDARAEEGPRREEATLEDVAKLKERLERQEQKEEALDDLARVQKEARDPAVRKAAEDLLKKLGSESAGTKTGTPKGPPDKVAKGGPEKGNGDPVPKGQGSEAGKGMGDGGKQGEPTPKNADGGANGGQKGADAGEPKKGGKRPTGGRAGQGTTGADDNTEPNPVDQAAARRAGELQLEKLRDRLEKNPELMKKMKWTQKDVERFIERARDYQAWLRRQEKAAGDPKRPGAVGKNVLPGFNPRLVGPRANAVRDPLELGVAQPPPEFREAQRLFTSKPRE